MTKAIRAVCRLERRIARMEAVGVICPPPERPDPLVSVWDLVCDGRVHRNKGNGKKGGWRNRKPPSQTHAQN